MLNFIRKYPIQTILFLAVIGIEIARRAFVIDFYAPDLTIVRIIVTLAFSLSVLFGVRDLYGVFRVAASATVVSLVALVTGLMFVMPLAMDVFAREDGPVENLSAVLCFTSVFIWLVYCARSVFGRRWLFAGVSLLFAVVIFVIGMEEISWMQRILDVQSSEYFLQNNMQQEMNLHNINTGLSEKTFYTVGILVLVIVPFYRDNIVQALKKYRRLSGLAAFVPSAWMSVPFATIVGLAGLEKFIWTTVLIVAVFSFGILVRKLAESVRNSQQRHSIWLGIVLAVQVFAIAMFVFSSIYSTGIRRWMPSEYLELFIEFGLLVYTIDFMFRNTKLLSGKKLKEV